MSRAGRTGYTHPFGKLDDEPLPATKVPTAVKQKLQADASKAGLPLQEYLRELVTIAAMGSDVVKDAYAKRIDAIAGKLKE